MVIFRGKRSKPKQDEESTPTNGHTEPPRDPVGAPPSNIEHVNLDVGQRYVEITYRNRMDLASSQCRVPFAIVKQLTARLIDFEAVSELQAHNLIQEAHAGTETAGPQLVKPS